MTEAPRTERRGRQLFCRIITPEKMAFDGEVDLLVVRIADGDLGVMVDHAPTVSTAEPGEVMVRQGDERRYFAISDGFFKVYENLAQILVEDAKGEDEIDLSAAGDRIEEIEAELGGLTGDDDETVARREELERQQRIAEAQVRVARRRQEGRATA